jgi:C_GCAxxG_C_C family probable redox protein
LLLAVCKATNWESECIPRIASGLGGGVGRQGEVCGALTSGVLIVGLVHGRNDAKEIEAKEAAHAKAGEFVRRFADVNGAIQCRDLIGLDVSTDEGVQEYYKRNLQDEKCSDIVGNAVRVILELLTEWRTVQ